MSPRALPTPCGDPTCPELVKTRFCETHRPQKWKGYDRPNAGERGYDAAWRKVRKRYLHSVHGLCERCAERGVTKAASLVHHLVPLADGGARLDTDNLQALCRPCHRAVHRAMRG